MKTVEVWTWEGWYIVGLEVIRETSLRCDRVSSVPQLISARQSCVGIEGIACLRYQRVEESLSYPVSEIFYRCDRNILHVFLSVSVKKNLWYFLGITSSDKHVGCAIATSFQLMGAPLSIIGPRMFMSLGDSDVWLPFIVLHIEIRHVSMQILCSLLLYLYATSMLEVSIPWPPLLWFADE